MLSICERKPPDVRFFVNETAPFVDGAARFYS